MGRNCEQILLPQFESAICGVQRRDALISRLFSFRTGLLFAAQKRETIFSFLLSIAQLAAHALDRRLLRQL
jgi:hypothetical protein